MIPLKLPIVAPCSRCGEPAPHTAVAGDWYSDCCMGRLDELVMVLVDNVIQAA